MTRIALFAAALALTIPAFAADSEATFDKTLTFSGAPTISVATGSGYIHVNPGPDNQFHIIGHVHANSGWLSLGASNDAVKQIAANPPITQSGNIITIGHHGDSDLYRNVSIDYDVTTPRTTALSAHTGSGGIQVAGIQGAVNAGSGSGSVQLTLVNSPDVKANTGSGSIRIEGVAASLTARTGSGSIDIAGNPSAAWNLSTGSGGIHIRLASNSHFTLSADTGSGSVHIDQPIVMQGTLGHHHVSGTVNGGGPTLRATTGSGSITINGTSTIGQLDDNNALHVPGATDCVDHPTQSGCRNN